MPVRRGFTFVEILTAMVFFSALGALAVPRYHSFRDRAHVAVLTSSLGHLRVAQETYWAEHHRYAADTALLEVRQTTGVTITLTVADEVAGYEAVARHSALASRQCEMWVGREGSGRASGEIDCGAGGRSASGAASVASP